MTVLRKAAAVVGLAVAMFSLALSSPRDVVAGEATQAQADAAKGAMYSARAAMLDAASEPDLQNALPIAEADLEDAQNAFANHTRGGTLTEYNYDMASAYLTGAASEMDFANNKYSSYTADKTSGDTARDLGDARYQAAQDFPGQAPSWYYEAVICYNLAKEAYSDAEESAWQAWGAINGVHTQVSMAEYYMTNPP